MKWYQVKEQSAGRKRLLLTWWGYKIFGKNFVIFIAFWVSFFTFCFASGLRKYSRKYLKIVGINSGLVNQFRHFLSYALSLVDKIEIFSNNFDIKKVSFADENCKKLLFEDLKNRKGIFFICSHLGNIDVMRTFLTSNEENTNVDVNVFLSKEQCKIFNEFIKQISAINRIKTYPVEDINIDTSITLKECLDKGEIAFMAGDRTSKTNQDSTYKATLFDKTVELPTGTFKLAQLMKVPIYCIAALKAENDTYIIHLKKVDNCKGTRREMLKNNITTYAKFLEEKTLLAPLQFYHFYDFFADFLG